MLPDTSNEVIDRMHAIGVEQRQRRACEQINALLHSKVFIGQPHELGTVPFIAVDREYDQVLFPSDPYADLR